MKEDIIKLKVIKLKEDISERLKCLQDCFECEDYLAAYHHAEFIKQALDDLCYIEDKMLKGFINNKLP